MNITLDQNTLLSESKIWQQQSDFYKRQGISAWNNQVPFYATSNAFIANVYAEMIHAALHDWQAKTGATQFNIVEFGAGCGQFSYLCMRMLDRYCFASGCHWRYIMSDFDQQLLDFWQQHPGFKPFIESSQLCIVKEQIGGSTAALESFLHDNQAPIIVIANYLFDSLPADIYKISGESIYPVRVTFETDEDNLDDKNAVIDFERVVTTYDTDTTSFATDDDVLEQYRLELLDSRILYPQAGIEFLKRINDLSQHGALLITTDKAFAHADELDYLDYPELTGHNGCFSFMANFDAMRRYVELNKGDTFIPSTKAGIKTAVFGLQLHCQGLPSLQVVMHNQLQIFGPSDYLNLYRNMQKKLDTFNLEEAVSFLALSRWDATVFQRLYDRIFEQLQQADLLTVNYLCDHLPLVAEHYYWLEKSQDVLFQIAIVYHTLKRYADALRFYEQSLLYFPGIFGLYFNMGVCHFHLNQSTLAYEYFQKAHELDPDDDKTKEWLGKLA